MSSTNVKKVFFWILVCLFLLVAPVIVIYSMGYRFSFERGVFIYSGSITIKPTPREVEIFLDNKRVSTGMVNFLNYSYHMGSILPGRYVLEVKAPGYLSWAKEVYVHSGVSTEFWNTFLVRENYTQVVYPTKQAESFFISPDGKRVALVERGEGETWVKILDIKKEEILYAFNFVGYNFSANKKDNIEWSPKEGRLAVPMEKDGKKEYFIISIGDEEVFNLNEKLKTENIRKLRWSSGDRNTLFYIQDEKLFRLDLDNLESSLEVANNLASYDLSGSNIYYFSKENGIIYQKNISGRGEATQITTQSITAKSGDDFELIAYDEDRIAVIDQDKKLYLYNQGEIESGIKELATDVLGVHFSNDGKKIALWSNNEIAVYFVRKWETQPARAEGQKIDIVRFSQPISNVGWFKDYEHLIFSTGNQIKIVELDNRSLKNINNLVTLKDNVTKANYNVREDNLFYIDKAIEAGGLCSISLTEENKD